MFNYNRRTIVALLKLIKIEFYKETNNCAKINKFKKKYYKLLTNSTFALSSFIILDSISSSSNFLNLEN